MNKNELLIEFLGSDGSVRLTNSRRFKSLLPLLRQLTQDCPERFTDPERLSVLHLGYIPTCKVCSGPSKLNGKHWQTYCSKFCMDKDSSYLNNKKKKTSLLKFGTEFSFQSEEVKEKIKQTNLKKYGVDHPSKSKEIRERVEQTCLERYGVKNSYQIDKIREKAEQTCLERYGSRFVLQTETGRELAKKTILLRYGVENAVQCEEIKEKIRQTNLERYGVEYAIQNKNIMNKLQNTNLERYGHICSLHNDKIQDKAKQTNLEKYGVTNYNKLHFSSIIHLLEDQDWWNQWGSFGEVRDYLISYMTLTTIYRKARQYRPDWDFSNISSPHQRINSLLDSLNIQYETNTKQIIAPLELDVFIADHNLAIEVNGLYWHSELQGKDKNYHLNKFLQCQAKGIRLLQFWDSEINNNWSTAELIIKGYLGLRDVQVEEGANIIQVDNRFPWDYSSLGFTLVEQTLYTDYQNVYEEPGNNRDRIWDCGVSIYAQI